MMRVTFRMSEKREFERSLLVVPVQVTHPAFGTVMVESGDLSPGGVFVRAGHEVPRPAVGTVYEVRIHGMMDGSSRVVPAEVMHARTDGFGLRFLADPYLQDNPA